MNLFVKLLYCGQEVSLIESILFWALPLIIYSRLTEFPKLQDFFFTNALYQAVLFILIVHIPAFFTRKMTYVDIGWPTGLVFLAVKVLWAGHAEFFPRLFIPCLLLFIHGGRMSLGAIFMFGQKTKFTYRFKEDLPRYKFAKIRWVQSHKNSTMEGLDTWDLKMQHDCFQQGWVNMTLLALPMGLMRFNDSMSVHWLEWTGLGIYLCAFVFENYADAQKIVFMRTRARERRAENKVDELRKDRYPVLGYTPYNGSSYSLWTISRHPNYLGELLCWVGVTIAAIPSALLLTENDLMLRVCILLELLLIPRLFYDCLVSWTGAAPAEYFSVKKRHYYTEYQKSTPCLFPFKLPFISQYMDAGWPHAYTDVET